MASPLVTHLCYFSCCAPFLVVSFTHLLHTARTLIEIFDGDLFRHECFLAIRAFHTGRLSLIVHPPTSAMAAQDSDLPITSPSSVLTTPTQPFGIPSQACTMRCKITEGLKLPALWPANANAWFAQAEGQFALSGIVQEKTHYWYIVTAPDNSSVLICPILHRPDQNCNRTLKTLLLLIFGLATDQHTCHLLAIADLRDCSLPRSWTICCACMVMKNPASSSLSDSNAPSQ